MTDELRADMAANVWKVLVLEGDIVTEGDTLVILESMKMEIPVVSTESGSVTSVSVREGETVQEGDLIAIVG